MPKRKHEVCGTDDLGDIHIFCTNDGERPRRWRPAAEAVLWLFLPESQHLRVWRPEPESNRRARICSPLRNHSAIGPPGAQIRYFSRWVNAEVRDREHRSGQAGV